MGILPLQFKDGTSAQTLNLDGTETFDISGLAHGLKPQQAPRVRLPSGADTLHSAEFLGSGERGAAGERL